MEHVEHITLNKVDEAVLYALKYYSLFKYPLTAEEVYGNSSCECSLEDVTVSLNELYNSRSILKYKGFYSSDPNIKKLVEQRVAANTLADIKIPKAERIGRLIAKFPFVKFVGISGSLSKGYADRNSDYDFFIVTSEHRLWICRTILHLFKKLTFLFFQEQKFCMNYFIDESKLRLEEQNIYTAIELSTLIPVSGASIYRNMQNDNHYWVRNFLPNPFKAFYSSVNVSDMNHPIKRLIEMLIDPIGGTLNKLLMQLTDKRWRKKWKKRNYPEADYNLAFKTTLHHSKNHPANYQKKVLAKLSGT